MIKERERIQALRSRIEKARAGDKRRLARERKAEGAALGMAMRLGATLLAAAVIGAAIGWLVDRAFGVAPFGIIGFFLLGAAAGIRDVIRAAMAMQERRAASEGKAEKAGETHDIL